MSSSITVQSKQRLLDMLRRMLTIRRFEERVKKEFADTNVKGFVHLYIGEEAVAVGVCSNLRKDDYVTSTHRGHGHCIAKGVEVNGMMAELFGKKTGTCKGKGGSMHIADLELGMLGANGIVGGGLPIAIGAALSSKYRKSDQVAVAFFSDGALNQGTFHESMNIASIWKLPAIFVCENNGFAEATSIKYHTSVKDPTVRAGSYNMPGVRVDGMDVMAVSEAASEAVNRARRGDGPTFIVCDTYRYMGHFEGDDQTYRTKQDVEDWKTKDPILRLRDLMIREGALTDKEYDDMNATVLNEIDDAVAFAQRSGWPERTDVLEDVYTSL
jgi:acetoin:2,6-dichlorophenolindophenol oxidoreductase subunit alpha